jgi:hypothetical protein
MKTEFWIATRVLKGTKDQVDLQIEVAVGQPEIAAEGEWRCAFRISYEGREHLQHGHGIDAIQALVQALEGIRVTLGTIGTPTTWEGGEPGDHGFPRLIPQFYGLAFAKKIDAMIDAELLHFAEVATKKGLGKG